MLINQLGRFPQRIMPHMVLAYGGVEESRRIFNHYIQANVKFIEIQIPFSDPSADGEKIYRANQAVKKMTFNEFENHLDFIIDKHSERVVLMSYLTKCENWGFDRLFGAMKARNIDKIIIPDLPYDAYLDYYQNVYHNYSIQYIPVIARNVSIERINWIIEDKYPFIYLMSYTGVSGQFYKSTQEADPLLHLIKSKGIPLAIGFGIRTIEDIQDALTIADIAVIGSALI